ncbi:hypothetical protein FBR02_01415 [Anaerolineae bacterium CFX9]|jgi:hypothetical protein|nr:hypothetical protein [Oscillatoria laete-virens]MDL1899411.1 hypothetical protein [Anaerolineae bacterium CFX9]MDL5052890.1 hypothetical protein [Oscillatoria laete-virens NRMC-F 0139]
MAYLNQQQREALREELLKLKKLGKAAGRLRGMDKKVRVGVYRNMQKVGQFHTRYELPSLGARVTLIEQDTRSEVKDANYSRREYDLVDVRVEPTADNVS